MCRRVLNELEWNPSAVGLLQGIYKTAVTIFEILVDDFELAFELHLWSSSLPLSYRTGVGFACVGVVRQSQCAGEEQEAGENRPAKDCKAEDPRGTDLDLHVGTFLPP